MIEDTVVPRLYINNKKQGFLSAREISNYIIYYIDQSDNYYLIIWAFKTDLSYLRQCLKKHCLQQGTF